MSNEIKNRDYFTVENFQRLNGACYNPSDLRTYKMLPLASLPYEDVLIHLSIPKEGDRGGTLIRTNQGSFTGNQFSETMKKAERSVLHFPRASDVDIPKGLVKLEDRKMLSLYPSWILSRYGVKNLQGLLIHHVVPLFIDKRTKEFVYFFDEAMLDEMDVKNLVEGVQKDCFRVYKGKTPNKRYLALITKDFEQLEDIGSRGKADNPVNEAFWQIKENYEQTILDASQLEKVIVIAYSKNNKDHDLSDRVKTDGIHKVGMTMTFGLAARHNNNFYWIDQDGSINTRQGVGVNRSHANPSPFASGNRRSLDQETWKEASTVVIPYTDKDWDRLVRIQARLEEIQAVLGSLIKGCEDADNDQNDLGLEQAILNMQSASLLGLDKPKE